MLILVTGASGYVGSRLIPRLLGDGHEVRALARDPARIKGRVEGGRFEERLVASTDTDTVGATPTIVTADALTGTGLARALADVEVAYYLIHSMERPRAPGEPASFAMRERRAAESFAAAAAAAGVRRLVYLGGPTASWTAPRGKPEDGDRSGDGNDDGNGGEDGDRSPLSAHLRSRAAVEDILRAAVPDTVALHASIVIGAGSRSFRFMVRLVERMPVLPLPAWRTHRTRPIDERDVLDMLAAAATPTAMATTAIAGSSLDVGGPDVLAYGEMIARIADAMLVRRPAVGLGVNATALTARVAAAIAGEEPELVIALMESLRGDLLPDGEDGCAHLRAAELLDVELHSFDAAVERALREWEAVEELAAR